ncbi:MAG TPA: OmpA family protein [Planctomycetota bacterium]|nr:OmpA family protein [Planctomycetota bacterium]
MSKKAHDAEPHAPLWCLTYGDMVTQLTAFFMVLFVMASAKGASRQEAAAGIRDRFNRYKNFSGNPLRSRAATSMAQFQGARANALIGPEVTVTSVARGRMIAIGGKTLFDKGSAQLRPASYETLSKIVDIVKGYKNQLEITGHASASEVGPGSRFEDEWELSWRRARAVAEFLAKTGNIPESRLMINSSSYHRAAAANLTGDEDSRNRRVEILEVSLLDQD